MNQIPEEIRNILFPEFLMKELSNLENCKEGCQSCCKAQNDGGRLSDLCLHLQFSRVQAKISRTVPEVFAFIKMQQLAHSQWTPKRRTMSDAIHEAFPSLTLPQCVQLVHAWAVYDAKYENPVDMVIYFCAGKRYTNCSTRKPKMAVIVRVRKSEVQNAHLILQSRL